MTVNTWRVPRESVEWVGPVVVTLTDRETGQPVDQNVKLALVPYGTRPGDDDWFTPDLDPDGTGGYGYLTAAVDSDARLGFWAKDVDSPETPVLEPGQVGWLVRT